MPSIGETVTAQLIPPRPMLSVKKTTTITTAILGSACTPGPWAETLNAAYSADPARFGN